MKLTLNDYNFDLPEKLIAQNPLSERSHSRLLCLDKNTGAISHRQFSDLPELLQPTDLLVFNNTKVIPARLYGAKLTGGKVEVMIEKIINDTTLLAQIKSNKNIKIGTDLLLEKILPAKITAKQNDFYIIDCILPKQFQHILEFLNQHGHVPLPPYIKHSPDAKDQQRYQTIFAKHPGAVAAPTASLHFDEPIMQRLAAKKIQTAYVTLHVGAGTFQPIRVENILEHKMHAEYAEVPATTCAQIERTKANGGRIIAVGTTTVRSLETAAKNGNIAEFRGETNIFIYPGYEFRCVDAIITNFHLPKSTLLLLVSAFAGRENIMHAYQEAIKENYRFFSYGDAMFIG